MISDTRKRLLAAAACGFVALFAVACGAAPGAATTRTDVTETVDESSPSVTPQAEDPDEVAEPPRATLGHGETELRVEAWSACGQAWGCFDSAPPTRPDDLGVVSEAIDITVPLDGLKLGAVARDPDSDTAIPVTAKRTGARSWQVVLRVPAGTYHVDLVGKGTDIELRYTVQATRR